MVAVVIAAILIYVVGCGMLFVWVICTAPKKFGDVRFQRRWKFLFIKYRPDAYWWSLPFLAKGVGMNIGFAIFVIGTQQLYWMMGVVGLYVMGAIWAMPWRSRAANILEIFVHVDVLFVVSLLIWYSRDAIDDPGVLDTINGNVSALIVLLNVVPVPLAGLVYSSAVYDRILGKQSRVNEQKALILKKSWTAFVQWEPKDIGGLLDELSDWDRNYLLQATAVLEAEVLMKQTKKRVFAQTSTSLSMEEKYSLVIGDKPCSSTISQNSKSSRHSHTSFKCSGTEVNVDSEPLANLPKNFDTEFASLPTLFDAFSRDDGINVKVEVSV
jgi:hypothetical protein